MQLTIKLMGMLKNKEPEGGVLELADGATIEDALVALEIPSDTVHVFSVNSQLERDKSRQLADGDDFSVFPPVGGG